MQFTERSLEKFKRIYKKIFSEELSDEEAKRKAEFLVNLYKIIYQKPEFGKFIDNQIENED